MTNLDHDKAPINYKLTLVIAVADRFPGATSSPLVGRQHGSPDRDSILITAVSRQCDGASYSLRTEGSLADGNMNFRQEDLSSSNQDCGMSSGGDGASDGMAAVTQSHSCYGHAQSGQ